MAHYVSQSMLKKRRVIARVHKRKNQAELKNSKEDQSQGDDLGWRKKSGNYPLLVAVPLFNESKDPVQNEAYRSWNSDSNASRTPHKKDNREDQKAINSRVDLTRIELSSSHMAFSQGLQAGMSKMDKNCRSSFPAIAAPVEQAPYPSEKVIDH